MVNTKDKLVAKDTFGVDDETLKSNAMLENGGALESDEMLDDAGAFMGDGAMIGNGVVGRHPLYDETLDFAEIRMNARDLKFENAKRIGENMRELRKRMGWKQIKVANALGMPLTTYNAYELGYNRQNGGLIIALAKLYNVTTDRILGFKDKEYSPCTVICIDHNYERQVYTLNYRQFDFVEKMIAEVGNF